MAPLSSRERVLMAVEHEEPDQVPFIFGAGLTTGIQTRAYQRLKVEWPFHYNVILKLLSGRQQSIHNL